mmetsp:Transcript_3687/g.4096  ORF Transcript_3687/g.4096 Transcript_3687/m.4096 type:complete len:781 (-) Transcript_3687:417-2759(-)|eukprot:CAMPEP_0194143420 /NCGR_PEP_ID=MMETSP0152-20130528/12593_1 /TAXON_ID=1049557 /ORGANISM="Thalassiothrix antarctica, Strain L6-D1" /LENGTH=780 /DNA_ID=CAMNT_0038842827 /DNA_START=263 /DNA_END=2605 /DNA_ORIENTATION=+
MSNGITTIATTATGGRRRRRSATDQKKKKKNVFHRLYSQTTIASKYNKYNVHKQLLEERKKKIVIQKEDAKEYYKKNRTNTGRLYSKSTIQRFHNNNNNNNNIVNDLSYDIYNTDTSDLRGGPSLNRTSQRFQQQQQETEPKNNNDVLNYDDAPSSTSDVVGPSLNRTSGRFEKVVMANNHTYVVDEDEEDEEKRRTTLNLYYNNRTSQRFQDEQQQRQQTTQIVSDNDNDVLMQSSMIMDEENSQQQISTNNDDVMLSPPPLISSSSVEDKKRNSEFSIFVNPKKSKNNVPHPLISRNVSETSQRTTTTVNTGEEDEMTPPTNNRVSFFGEKENTKLPSCISSTTTSDGDIENDDELSISSDNSIVAVAENLVPSNDDDDKTNFPPKITTTGTVSSLETSDTTIDIHIDSSEVECSSCIHTTDNSNATTSQMMKIPEKEELEYLFHCCMDENSNDRISLIVLDSVIEAYYPNYFHLNPGSYKPVAFHFIYMQDRCITIDDDDCDDDSAVMDRNEFYFFMHYLVYYHNLSKRYGSSDCIRRENFREVLKDMNFLNSMEKDNNDVNELFDMIDVNSHGFIQSDDFCNFLTFFVLSSSEEQQQKPKEEEICSRDYQICMSDEVDCQQSMVELKNTSAILTDDDEDQHQSNKLENCTLETVDATTTEVDDNIILNDDIVVNKTTEELENWTININKRRASSISEILVDGIPEEDFKFIGVIDETTTFEENHPFRADRQNSIPRSEETNNNYNDDALRINRLNIDIMMLLDTTATRCYYFYYPN